MDNTEEILHDEGACTVVDETGLEGNKMKMTAYLKRGLSLLLIGQHKESTICYQEVAKLASQIEDKEAEMKAYVGLGRAFSNMGDFESSEKFFLKALAVANQHNDNNLVKEACIMLGNVYYTAGKFENALESYLEAQKISVELGARKDKTLVEFQHLGISFVVVERKDEANICFMLGNTFQQLKREEKAIESYQRAMDISNELKDNEMQVLAEQRLGEMSPHNFPTDQESELVTGKLL
jgi:tetratricopeptide (TPR) repeat protein